MSYTVDFKDVSTVGLESSPVAEALAGLRANEARYFKNKYDYAFAVDPAKKAKKAVDWVHKILKDERDIVIGSPALEATEFEVEGIRMAYVFYESGLSINVMYRLADGGKRAVGFKLSEGMEIPDELSKFKFAAAEVEARRERFAARTSSSRTNTDAAGIEPEAPRRHVSLVRDVTTPYVQVRGHNALDVASGLDERCFLPERAFGKLCGPRSRDAGTDRGSTEPVAAPAVDSARTAVSFAIAGAAAQPHVAVGTCTSAHAGLTPCQLRSAYGLAGATGGTGQTVAIVAAYDNPKAEADLAVYRRAYRLPACTTANGCFRKVNQEGLYARPGRERDLGAGDRARPRHGLGRMPAVPHPSRRGDVVEVDGPPHRREPGRDDGSDGDLQQLGLRRVQLRAQLRQLLPPRHPDHGQHRRLRLRRPVAGIVALRDGGRWHDPRAFAGDRTGLDGIGVERRRQRMLQVRTEACLPNRHALPTADGRRRVGCREPQDSGRGVHHLQAIRLGHVRWNERRRADHRRGLRARRQRKEDLDAGLRVRASRAPSPAPPRAATGNAAEPISAPPSPATTDRPASEPPRARAPSSRRRAGAWAR